MARPGRADSPDVRGVGESMRTSPITVAMKRNSSIRTDRKTQGWLVLSLLVKWKMRPGRLYGVSVMRKGSTSGAADDMAVRCRYVMRGFQ